MVLGAVVFTYPFQEPNALSITLIMNQPLNHPLLLKHESRVQFPSRRSSTSYFITCAATLEKWGGGLGER